MKNIKISKSGSLAEDLACKYLRSNGYEVLDRNVSYKFGEVDIVASKRNILHILEVKSIVVRNAFGISREPNHDPEELVGQRKLTKMRKVGDIIYEKYSAFREVKMSVISIYLDMYERKARIRMLEVWG